MKRVVMAAAMLILAYGAASTAMAAEPESVQRGYTIPLVDLADQTERQTIVDREPGQYLGHPTTVLLEDGKTMIAVLLRENSRKLNSFAIFSDDEGKTWSGPRDLPGALTGDRHTGRFAPDGRLFITFRDTTLESPTKGDWVGWVGTYEDIVRGREGQYRVRLMKNHKGADCAYPGLELLPDGTFVTTTYGHWTKSEMPYVVSVRFTLNEIDAQAKK